MSTILYKRLFVIGNIITAIFLNTVFLYAQCPTGDVNGNITISGTCTIAAGENITINGNLTLDGDLVLEAGASLTITGTLSNSYVGSSTERSITGGTVNVNAISFGNNLVFVAENTTINVSNDVTIGYHGGMKLDDATLIINGSFTDNSNTGPFSFSHSTITTNGDFTTSQQATYTISDESIITVYGDFSNNNGTDITLNNSSFIMPNASSSFLNNYQSTFIAENGSTLSIAGNLTTENESTLTIDDSDVEVGGDMNNDFYADLNVQNGSTLDIGGDFNNGVDYNGNVVNSGSVDIDGGSVVTIGNDFNNEYDSDLNITDGGVLGVTNDVHNGHSSVINVDGGTLYYGGTLDNDDYGTINADDSCLDGCCGVSCDSTLPVTLIDFSANLQDNSVKLEWSTASEDNNDYFTIRQSTNGTEYLLLTKVPGQGNTKNKTNYTHTDNSYTGLQTYYQLSQTDYDGTETYLSTIVVYPEDFDASQIKVVPNPATTSDILQIMNVNEVGAAYTLYSINGQSVRSGYINANNAIPIADIQNGIYMLSIQNYGFIYKTKIVIR